MARVKTAAVTKQRHKKILKELKDTLEVNIDYIKLQKNN